MLNGVLTLHDIRDVDAFVATIVTHSRLKLTHHQREDLSTFLIETCWELSLRDPQPWRTSFSGWVTPLLRVRIVDWQRQPLQGGRTTWSFKSHERDTGRKPKSYERERPTLVPLDNQLGTADTTGHMGNPEHRDPDLLRHLTTRDRPDAGPYPTLGRSTARSAA